MHKEIFFSQYDKDLNDSFYLTQSLIHHHSRKSLLHPPENNKNQSFLPKINRSDHTSVSLSDATDHLNRRKKKPKQSTLKNMRSVVLSKYIEGVSKQAMLHSENEHQKRLHSLKNQIIERQENDAQLKLFVNNEKYQMKKVTKDLYQMKGALLKNKNTLEDLKSKKQILVYNRDQYQSTLETLRGYENFCNKLFQKDVKQVQSSEMFEALQKLQHNCLSESQLIKFIYLSISKIKKQYQIAQNHYQPKKYTLSKQVEELQKREHDLDQQIEHLKYEKLKRKNITNVRHPFLSIAPKVMVAGIQKMKMSLDLKSDESPLQVLRQLQNQIQKVLRSLQNIKNQNQLRVQKVEVQLLKNQSHQAYKNKK